MADDNVTRIIPDAERATNLRERARPHLEAICAIMDEARANGLVLNFQINTNGYGKSAVQDITVVKPL